MYTYMDSTAQPAGRRQFLFVSATNSGYTDKQRWSIDRVLIAAGSISIRPR